MVRKPTPDASDEQVRASGADVALPEGITLGDPAPARVEEYPERSYADALSDEHREVLTKADQLPE